MSNACIRNVNSLKKRQIKVMFKIMLFPFVFNPYRLQNVMEYRLKRSLNLMPSSTKELHRSNSVLSKNAHTRNSSNRIKRPVGN